MSTQDHDSNSYLAPSGVATYPALHQHAQEFFRHCAICKFENVKHETLSYAFLAPPFCHYTFIFILPMQ